MVKIPGRPSRDDTPPRASSGSGYPPQQQEPEGRIASTGELVRSMPSGLSAASRTWRRWVETYFAKYYDEWFTHSIEIRRRMWGRLGNLLQRHPWCIQYREAFFEPVIVPTLVRRWTRINASRPKPKAKTKAKAKPKALPN